MSNHEQAETNNGNGEFERRFGSLERAMRDFLDADRQWKTEITEYIRKVDEKASNAGRSDMGTLAVWAGVIVAVIVAIVGGMGYLQEQTRLQNQQWMLREMDKMETEVGTLHRTVYEMPAVEHKAKPAPRRMTAEEYLSQP